MILKDVYASLEEFIFTGLPGALAVCCCGILRHVVSRLIFFFFFKLRGDTENCFLEKILTHKLWCLFNKHSM